jgi:hypothetical protein
MGPPTEGLPQLAPDFALRSDTGRLLRKPPGLDLTVLGSVSRSSDAVLRSLMISLARAKESIVGEDDAVVGNAQAYPSRPIERWSRS